ncbi:hypothetical protein C8J57DRAFT_1300400 [Mycena rebaudengoi]|nr:hypothetical protein C8J57DRAFT_1300400 [Mycena rebaudengoi]
MSLIPVPIDICEEIASHADRATLLQLFYLSSPIKITLRPFLYRHIEAGLTAELLVATLAEDAEISKLVRSLSLSPSGACYISGVAWEKALSQMAGLKHMGVSRNVDGPQQTHSFRLRSFSASGSLKPSWIRFLNSHPQLEKLKLYDRQNDVTGLMLPALRQLSGNANVIANLALFRPVEELVFQLYDPMVFSLTASDLIMLGRVKAGTLRLRIKSCQLKPLAEIAPKLLRHVRDLVLEDDSVLIGRQHHIREKTSIYACEHVLTEKYFPRLRSLHIVSHDGIPTGDIVIWAMTRGQVLPSLEHIHFCATSGCSSGDDSIDPDGLYRAYLFCQSLS